MGSGSFLCHFDCDKSMAALFELANECCAIAAIAMLFACIAI